MAADFTTIINVRQHFGDDPNALPGAFAGKNKDFNFDCPNIDSNQPAVLLFESLGVDHEKNFIAINSTGATGDPEVFGGIPVSRSHQDWNGNVMLVRPNVLRESGNVLRLGARNSQGSILGDVDDFVIDNVVILYKSRGPGAARSAESASAV